MTDTTLSLALKEAYASAPAGLVVYHTLELRHPAFTAPIRVVRDFEDLTATLEVGAPADPGASVLFNRFAFEFTKPEVATSGVPQITITIDNVNRAIVANLEAALATTDLVQITYREYLSNDLTGPQNNPPLTMTMLTANADVFKVTATAGFPDLMNRRFPSQEYSAEVFPGLTA